MLKIKGAISQSNDWLTLLVPSLAVTVTACGVLLTEAVIVPEISPVLLLMLRPAGKPEALYVIVGEPEPALEAFTNNETTSPGTLI